MSLEDYSTLWVQNTDIANYEHKLRFPFPNSIRAYYHMRQ